MTPNRQTLFQKIITETHNEPDYDKSKPQYSLWLRILVIVVTILLISIFFIIRVEPKFLNSSQSLFEEGNAYQGPTIIADFTFPIYKSQSELESERALARQNALLVFRLDTSVESTSIMQLNMIYDALAEVNNLTSELAGIQINESLLRNFLELQSNQKDSERNKIRRELQIFLREIYKFGYINLSLSRVEKQEVSVFVSNIDEFILPKQTLTDQSTFQQQAEKLVNSKISEKLRPLALEIINKVTQPNLIYDRELSSRAQDVAAQSVPRTLGIVRQGDVIVEKGSKITQDVKNKISSYQNSSANVEEEIANINFIIGSIGHTALVFSILLLYLFLLRPALYYDNLKLSIMSGLILLSTLFSWLSVEIQTNFPIEFLIIIPAISMLSAIVFDSRTGFYITLVMALLLAGVRGNDYTTAVTMIFAGSLAAYTVRDIQNRTQMFHSMFFIFIGLTIPILIFALERSMDIYVVLQRFLFAGINSAIAPLITFGLLYIIERTSDISTDLRIKEFDNLNHPLLIKLSEVAPGTYQHSLGVAMLSERCARELGANTLLVKVGSYYHDIGKMIKPEYFAENQMGMESKHNLLPPKKSASIIKGHVTDGVDLAKKYKLPERLIDFIETHHGNTLILHFYAEALEEAQGKEVHEDDYRYPGPRPKTKEEAIVMICDSAEAIARIVAKTDDEIESILDKSIEMKISDGQFNSADISIPEIRKIKEIIMKNIKGKSHLRVAYKEIPKDNKNG